ncbi:co-chaperone DjlA [Alkalilimnicola ehrlichii]|uniref:co-chaperone DjlA n=1 Tax=Alkalilimnicola ehrlichii TaxID=351052 RepID=UPI0011C05539|nr:co-chaperone DjlA [Alkalilimnicola ehrlichii]
MARSITKLKALFAPRWGRMLAAIVGWLVAGLWGAIIGLVFGTAFDYARLLWRFGDYSWRSAERSLRERRYLIGLFAVMGQLAKVDGRVSEYEVAAARAIMSELGLSEDERRRAVNLFTWGKRPGLPLRTLVVYTRRSCADGADRERFLNLQVRVALANGSPAPEQVKVLKRICRGLGINPVRLDQLLRRQRGGQDAPRKVIRQTLQKAYDLLGIPETATDQEVKRAYRRCVSRHHPDRMVAQGLSDSEVQAAARRTHEIREAYNEIRRVRNL